MIATLLNQASAAQTASGVSAALAVRQTPTLAVDVNVTAVSGTSPTLTVFLERLGADGVWYPIWSPTVINAAGQTSTSVGPGCATAAVLTNQVRLRWVIGGSASPSVTFSASIIGRSIADA